MNDAVREEILDLMRQLGDEYPSFRFGQLVATVAFLAKGPTASAVSEVDDEEFLGAARQNLDQRTPGSHPGVGVPSTTLSGSEADMEDELVSSATGAGEAWPESSP